jgi:PilZ domain
MLSPPNRRRSERVLLRLSVLVLAEDEDRKQIQEQAETQVVNAHGGLLRMRHHLHVGQSFLLNNPQTAKEMSCRVVRIEEDGLHFFKVAFEFDRPAGDVWPIVFPASDWVASEVK